MTNRIVQPLTQEQLDSMKPKPYTRVELEDRLRDTEAELYRLMERFFTGDIDEHTGGRISNAQHDIGWIRQAIAEMKEDGKDTWNWNE